ncbi:MAG: MarR family transcriptional regulator [Rhodobacterales bacterium]|nr:MarR family transcriptional regulator [Rhodobacterales bacterium]
MTDTRALSELILRLARLEQAEAWQDDLNPAQRAALAYLARANRFSRAPSQVAEYLGTTRGTASQTLKALGSKGHVTAETVQGDRRSIRYQVTDSGRTEVAQVGGLERAFEELDRNARGALHALLDDVLGKAIRANRSRPFGLCQDCTHFRPAGPGGFCGLLSEPLTPEETHQICHEQAPRLA